jgi:VanZ family protein
LRFFIALKVAILFAFALQIEIVQYFIPEREFSLLDVVADMIGVGIGWIVMLNF